MIMSVESASSPSTAHPKRRRIRIATSASANVGSESWRRHNVGRLLNNAISRFESRILQLMVDSGHTGFSLSHIMVTRNLDVDGTRATELARRAGITKQSMGELVAQLEAGGVVARRPDPTDRRSRIVYFTPEGMAWLHAFRDALAQAEAEMQSALGARRLKALKEALIQYDEAPR
jgi:DNA-binding MarR family transcriptional regulator